MNVCVLSFFRNAGHGQAQRFLGQAAALRDQLNARGDRLRVSAVYGDSIDNTEQALIDTAAAQNHALALVEWNHGGPVFGSTEDPARLKALSALGNAGLSSIRKQDDVVIYVESDLLWTPETMIGLIDQLGPERQIIAPLVFAGEAFYDIFCFRKNGQRFSPFHPYHPELNLDGLTHVDSVGSCLVMQAHVARECRIQNDDVLMGFCADAWAKGYTVSVDATRKVVHP